MNGLFTLEFLEFLNRPSKLKISTGGTTFKWEIDELAMYPSLRECTHPDIKTDGGGDYCNICGKRWER